jgi:hypothetical protein
MVFLVLGPRSQRGPSADQGDGGGQEQDEEGGEPRRVGEPGGQHEGVAAWLGTRRGREPRGGEGWRVAPTERAQHGGGEHGSTCGGARSGTLLLVSSLHDVTTVSTPAGPGNQPAGPSLLSLTTMTTPVSPGWALAGTTLPVVPLDGVRAGSTYWKYSCNIRTTLAEDPQSSDRS